MSRSILCVPAKADIQALPNLSAIETYRALSVHSAAATQLCTLQWEVGWVLCQHDLGSCCNLTANCASWHSSHCLWDMSMVT